MTRHPRSSLPDGAFHATQRGNRQQVIYLTGRDALSFLNLLDDVARKYEWAVLAYVLMSNHYHVTAECEQCALSDGMRELNGLYAQRFNRIHGYRGHVFQGRFDSRVIESGPYLLEVIRYDVLNPVRAGVCAHPGDWPWSSYRATIGVEPARRCLDLERLLAIFGNDIDDARRNFAEHVESALPRPWGVSLPDVPQGLSRGQSPKFGPARA